MAISGFPKSIREDLELIIRVADDLKMYTYVVGGFPRDLVSGKGITDDTDLDITEKEGNAFDLAFFVASKYNLPEPEVYEASGTAMVSLPSGRVVEFHNAYHNVPHIIDQLYTLGVEPTSLNKDVYSRDFTINTLLYDPKTHTIIDLTKKGISDIENKILRTPLNPMKTLGIEPKRVLRGVRFKLEMGLTPTPEYEQSEKHFSPTLANFMITKPNSRMLLDTVKKSFNADSKRAYEEFEKLGLVPYLPRVEGMEEQSLQRVFGPEESGFSSVNIPASKNSWYKIAEEKLPGGLAEGKPDSDFNADQLKKGIEAELEHVDDRGMAKEIAKDHLVEDSKYYDHLEEMEKKHVKEAQSPSKVSVPVGIPGAEETDPQSRAMIERILEEREKHRAYIRRKRMEERKDSLELQEVFDAVQQGDPAMINKHIDDKKVRKNQEKQRILDEKHGPQ